MIPMNMIRVLWVTSNGLVSAKEQTKNYKLIFLVESPLHGEVLKTCKKNDTKADIHNGRKADNDNARRPIVTMTQRSITRTTRRPTTREGVIYLVTARASTGIVDIYYRHY